LRLLKAAGFEGVELVRWTGVKTAPTTQGAELLGYKVSPVLFVVVVAGLLLLVRCGCFSFFSFSD